MASAHLTQTGSGSGFTIGTLSGWFKFSKDSSGTPQTLWGYQDGTSNASRFLPHIDTGNNQIFVYAQNTAGNSTEIGLKTNRFLRDTSGWYHIVIAFDTTQSTASNRVKLYINGVQETSFASSTYPSQNYVIKYMSSTSTSYIGNGGGGSNNYYYNGLITHVNFVDGTALTPTSFGESDSNGVWIPKPSPSVTYGTNGFFLKMDNSGNMGLDSSGNSNNFTTSGTITQAKDTPSNVFATMNPLSKGSNISMSNGNTTVSNGSSDNSILGTIAPANGKYYWEAKCTSASTYANLGVTLASIDGSNHSAVDGGRVVYSNNGTIYKEGLSGQGNTATGTSFTTNDIIGIAFDTENGTLKFYKNGTLINTTTDNEFLYTNNLYIPCSGLNNGGFSFNFGNGYFGTTAVTSAGTNASGIGIFEYDVPTGYTALSTKGLNL
tara:strand:- start:3553 stop:4857 length:1305 start_codon:yes stop_codon:yes gene_type:complete